MTPNMKTAHEVANLEGRVEGWKPGSPRLWVSDVIKALGWSEEEGKARLLAAHRAGLIELLRFDLEPKRYPQYAPSTVRYLNAEFQQVRL